MDPVFWKGKTVLLTGHTGFKGSWLSLWLQELGVNLIGFSKSIPTEPSLYKLANVKKEMISVMGDIRNFDRVNDVIKKYKPEIIIHMAAQSLLHESYKEPLETFSTNVMGTVNLLEAIRTTQKSCVVINVTSDKCYENQELTRGYRENDPMGGYDPYSSSKGCAELATSSFRNSFFNPSEYKKHGIALASVRAGNVIGGGDWAKNRLIPDIMNSLLSGGKLKIRSPQAVRPWQFVLEPLRGYLMLAEKLWKHGPKYAEAWNFGPDSRDAKSVSWIAERLAQLWGSDTKWVKTNEKYNHETNYLRLDCKKAKTRLDWSPKTRLETALQLIVEWYKEYKKGDDIRGTTLTQIRDFNSM